MIPLRCSLLPIAMKCSQSVHPNEGEILINHESEVAVLGTVVHEVMAAIVTGDLEEVPDVQPYAAKYYYPDVDEVLRLCEYGLRAWRELRVYGDVWQAEVDLKHDGGSHWSGLTGHVDAISVNPEESKITIIDWKSGWLESDYRAQMLGYAHLADAWVGEAVRKTPTVTVFVPFLRHRVYHTFTFKRADFSEFDQWLQRVLDMKDTEPYRTGKHCTYCPRASSCPARVQLVRRTIEELTNEVYTRFSGPQLIDLWRRKKAVEQSLREFDERIRELVETQGAIVGVDTQLSYREEEWDVFDVIQCWPYFTLVLSDEEIAGAMKVRKAELKKAAEAHAPLRGKGKFWKEFMDALRESGAVTKEVHKKLCESTITYEVTDGNEDNR